MHTAPAPCADSPISTRSSASRRGSTRSGRSRRGRLDAGLVEVPAVPYRDPANAVLANPEVTEHRRFCGNCEAPVGGGRDGKPGRTGGFCATCGSAEREAPGLRVDW